MKRRDVIRWMGPGGVLALWLGPQHLAFGAQVVAVRMWPAPDYTRITIESDALLQARHFFVADPPRLAVDIEGMDLMTGLRELAGKVRADDPNVAGIRVGQHAPNVVRLVVDLKRPILPQVFSLQPVAAYQHRLVFDLYPAQAPDPIEQWLAAQTQQSAPTPPAAAAQALTTPPPAQAPSNADPLGALIAQQTPDRASSPTATTPAATPPTTTTTATASAATPGTSGASATDRHHIAAKQRPTPRSSAPVVTRTPRPIIVALDAGHGGEDPGAIGPGGTREKDVVLAITRLLRDRVNRTQVDGRPMRAFLTRDADFFIPLHVRVQKARRVQADLLVSIHADAFYSPRPRGGSVFALSTQGATSTTARWLADRENAADLVGGLNVKTKDHQVQRALLDMSTTAQINDSLRVGTALLGQMRQVGHLHKPRVEQAGFAVLRAPDVPSVLVETAFISNPDDERRLRTPQFQAQMADALLQGIVHYFQQNPPMARHRTA